MVARPMFGVEVLSVSGPVHLDTQAALQVHLQAARQGFQKGGEGREG